MKAIVEDTLDLCAALQTLGEATWEEIEQGVDTGQPLDEESITNYNLMRLAAAVPSVVVEKHSKKREWKSGADWEMWVGKPGSFIGFRLQAKILSPTSGSYESLYSSTRKATIQIDKLIASAEGASRQLFPLYAFYNFAPNHGAELQQIACDQSRETPSIVGWTVASAYQLQEALRSKPTKRLGELASLMVPMKCLYCCKSLCAPCTPVTTPPSDLANAVAGRAQSAWPDSPVDMRSLVHTTGPVYVERLFKGERPHTGWGALPALIATGFIRQRELPAGISRVLLIRDLQTGHKPPAEGQTGMS